MEENCFVLPVDDAAALKANLINVLGMPADEAGVLTFTVPQPLPLPDKTLVAKFVDGRVLIAPDAELLKKLDEFISQSTPEALAGGAPGDAVLTIKIERFKRSFGKILEGSMEMGAIMAANGDLKQADKLIARMKGLVEALWQVDVLEVRLSIKPKVAGEKPLVTALEFFVRPHPGSELDKILHGDVPTLKGHHARLLPPETPLALQFSLQGAAAAAALKSLLVDAQMEAPDSRAAKLLLGETLPALFKLIELGHGDGLLALLPRTGGITNVIALELKDPAGEAAVHAAFETFVKKATETMDAIIKEDIASAGGVSDDAPLLKAQFIVPDPGMKIHGWQLEMPILDELEKKDLDRSVGWPLTIHETVQRSMLLCTIGKKSGDALTAVVAVAAKDLPGPAPEPLPAGTCFQLILHPLGVMRTLLQTVEMPDAVEGERMLAGLKDGTLTTQIRIGNGSASVRFEVPSSVPAGLIPLVQRIIRSGMDPRDLLGGPKGGAVPAPPPP